MSEPSTQPATPSSPAPAKSAAEPEPPLDALALAPLLEVAARTGAVVLCKKCPEGYKRATWQHTAAAALHGWNLHDASAPMRITEDAYAAALAAVEQPDPLGRYHPHGPALSPYRSKQ